ncbi:MAG: hypothetical protein FWD53_01570 [Phycisphaerales bacterium]|nr:hypothetical protein [Phycisphaerales bacterium]
MPNIVRLSICLFVLVVVVGCGQLQKRSAGEVALDQVLGQYDLRGKVVLVQFGAVSCRNSDEGLKRMIALQNLGRGNLHFLRVEGGYKGSQDEAAIASFYQATKPPFPVHRDPQSALAQAVQATAFPTCVLVDTFGHIRYRGKFPEDQLGEWVAQLAVEKSDPGGDVPLFGTQVLDIPKLLRHTILPEVSQAPTTALLPLSNHMGKAGLLVIFVDVHCPFAATAMQDIPKITPILAKLNIPTVMVNLDDAKADVQKHYANHAFGVPVLYDVATTTKNLWSIASVPTLVYITADQQVGYNGVATWQDLATAVEQHLKLAANTIQFAPKGTGFG